MWPAEMRDIYLKAEEVATASWHHRARRSASCAESTLMPREPDGMRNETVGGGARSKLGGISSAAVGGGTCSIDFVCNVVLAGFANRSKASRDGALKYRAPSNQAKMKEISSHLNCVSSSIAYVAIMAYSSVISQLNSTWRCMARAHGNVIMA